MELRDKTIFVSPLDWGLGHATRIVPVVRQLLSSNNKVILGVTPLTRRLLEEEFPFLEKTDLPAYNVSYSATLPLWLKLLSDWKRISEVISREKSALAEIVKRSQIDVVISDSRFGLHSERTHNIFVTHQIFLRTPFGGYIAQRINRSYIQRFDEIWVPDYAPEPSSLAGALSHGKQFHDNIKFIGPQSRLRKTDATYKKFDYLLLVSGPEPQHTIFKELLLKKASGCPGLRFALVCNSPQHSVPANVHCFVFPDAQSLSLLFAESKCIICRSGYSTLMDTHLLGAGDLVLVPTPGQSEQEYLACYWQKKFNVRFVQQRDLVSFKF